MLVLRVQCRFVHLHIGVILVRSKLHGITRHRSEPREICKQIVALAENVSPLMPALSGCDKYANVASGVERDIRGVARAAARLLNDRGWIIRLVEVHPTQADAVGNTGMPQSLRPAEL